MEREPELKPNPLKAAVLTLPVHVASKARFWSVVFFMLWPWLCVSFGLFVLKDYRATIIIYALFGCIAPTVLLHHSPHYTLPVASPDTTLKKNKPLFWFIVLGILTTQIVFLSVFKFSHGFEVDASDFHQKTQAIQLQLTPSFLIFGAWIILGNPVVEEFFWRGTVYRQWKQWLPKWGANLLSSFFFGAWHWVILQHFYSPLWAVGLAGAVMFGGIIFAELYERTGRLYAPILFHGLGADLPLVLATYQSLLYCQHLVSATHP